MAMELGVLVATLRHEMAQAGPDLPLHRQLRLAIGALIEDHRLKTGASLPGERVLSQALGISRVTVRKSIEALVHDGLLHRSQGARTEVGSHVEKSLSTLTSFSEDMLARGVKPGCIWLSKELSRPSPAELMALGLAPKTDVVRLRRIRTADGDPLAVETAAVPTRFLPNPALVEDSLYAALSAQNAVPQRAIQRMRARPATPDDAALLDCPVGAPMLVASRRCFLADGQIVEFTETRYRGDVYDFVTELSR